MANSRRPERSEHEQPDRNWGPWGALDPEFIRSVALNVPRNPITGRIDMADITRYLSTTRTPEVMQIFAQAAKILEENNDIDLSTYDFASLGKTIKPETVWMLQLFPSGMVDSSNRHVDPDKAHSTPGLRPSFTMSCDDHTGNYRLVQECVGLPDSNTVLDFICRVFAKPHPPLTPCLPSFLLISIKYQQHVAVLQPFLDSLPPPFHWQVETPELAEYFNEVADMGCQVRLKRGMELAEQQKVAGNTAFSRKDRAGALKSYSKAIECLSIVLDERPITDQEQGMTRLLSICYANRAAAHLMAGEGMDPKQALQDSAAAEAIDPSYGKSYIRQARAHEVLGEIGQAQDSIARALRRSDLEDDHGLVDRLIDLQTGGQGFPDDEGDFKNLMLDILVNDKQSSERMTGIKGGWRTRCEAHFAKLGAAN